MLQYEVNGEGVQQLTDNEINARVLKYFNHHMENRKKKKQKHTKYNVKLPRRR
jgi:hypothetical protein